MYKHAIAQLEEDQQALIRIHSLLETEAMTPESAKVARAITRTLNEIKQSQ